MACQKLEDTTVAVVGTRTPRRFKDWTHSSTFSDYTSIAHRQTHALTASQRQTNKRHSPVRSVNSLTWHTTRTHNHTDAHVHTHTNTNTAE